MAMDWTDEQKQVIDSFGENLLVSAAAGSGKTAVLVQHVVEKVMDPVDPIGVQEMLIMTFTRAAAAEMKERIRLKMEEILREEPDNYHLRRQISLIDQAHICTIDSFSSWLVKNYFHVLDIDPDFRILDETEGKLLREDILEQVMEEAYLEEDPDFTALMNVFATFKGDGNIRDLILKFNSRAQSMMWPQRWIDSLAEPCESSETLSGYRWAQDLFEDLRQQLNQWCDLIESAISICRERAWLKKLEDMFEEELQVLRAPLEASDLDELMKMLAGMKPAKKVSAPKGKIEDVDLHDQLRVLKDSSKKAIDDMRKKYGCIDTASMAAQAGRALELQRGIALLAGRFYRRYQKAKKDKNVAEFNDVSHWALQILWETVDGEDRPTELARELGLTFREIIVDEYQDSNMIQEKLCLALSGEYRGQPNMFMVGDVKQSIYRFRMARPDLFMSKYADFGYDSGSALGRKIDLGRNFRSRGGTLEAVNLIFEQVMSRENGGIEYDEHARLIPGAGQYEGTDPVPEIVIIDNKKGEAESPELEARVIASRIRQMTDPVNPLLVFDKETGGRRPVRYSDIVILVRSAEGWAEELQQTLGQAGIPAYAEQKKGYFEAPEIQILLSFLKLLDNPRQDIPLAAVMRSPLGGFTDLELAEIASVECEDKHTDFWQRCILAAEQGICTETWERFADFLMAWRRRAVTMSIDELLERLLEESGYGLILSASVDGTIVMANVEMLMEKARAYENTIYHGIFNFLRYMEKIRTYDLDFGEASVVSEEEDLVRITTIHKSKGLEYPVVFVGGLGKQFNVRDASEAFLIDEKFGILCDSMDGEKRTKIRMPHKRYIAEHMEMETAYEELRILYVALTRAKEKLICVGTEGAKSSLDKKAALGRLWRTFRRADTELSEKVPAVLLADCNKYLDWLMISAVDHPKGLWEYHKISPEDIAAMETVQLAVSGVQKYRWLNDGFTQDIDPEMCRRLDENCRWQYPASAMTRAKSVYSVSELKHMAADEYLKTQEGIALVRQKNSDYEAGNNLGARRGTAYHLVMEKLRAADGCDPLLVEKGLDDLVTAGILAEDMREVISVDKLYAFYQSELGQRMAKAEAERRLYKEQPFVMGVDPEDTSKAMDPESDYILVQGIIDAFLIEDGHIVLWDYKTDRIPSNASAADYLTGMYREQLYQYRNALERAWGLPVTEIWIYSFAADQLIAL